LLCQHVHNTLAVTDEDPPRLHSLILSPFSSPFSLIVPVIGFGSFFSLSPLNDGYLTLLLQLPRNSLKSSLFSTFFFLLFYVSVVLFFVFLLFQLRCLDCQPHLLVADYAGHPRVFLSFCPDSLASPMSSDSPSCRGSSSGANRGHPPSLMSSVRNSFSLNLLTFCLFRQS